MPRHLQEESAPDPSRGRPGEASSRTLRFGSWSRPALVRTSPSTPSTRQGRKDASMRKIFAHRHAGTCISLAAVLALLALQLRALPPASAATPWTGGDVF